VQCGLVYDEEEWHREWQYIVSLSNWQPKNQANSTNAVSNNRYFMLLVEVLLLSKKEYAMEPGFRVCAALK